MLLLDYLIASLSICLALTFIAFIIFIFYRKHSIIDIFWAINIVTVILYLSYETAFSSLYHSTISVLLILWSLRLMSHILVAKLFKNETDRRYTKMIKSSELLSMAKQFSIQVFFQVFVSLSGFFLSQSILLNLYPIVFIILTIIAASALVGEFIADHQLKKHRESSSSICTTGLWQYSRHPNYLFDIIFWFSIACFSIGTNYFFISFLGPIALFVTIYFITGPYTERCSVESRGTEYKHYQET